MAKKAAKKKAVKKTAAKKSGIVSYIHIGTSKVVRSKIRNDIGKTRYYWVLIGHNNECLSCSETYETLEKCKQTAFQMGEQLGVAVRWMQEID